MSNTPLNADDELRSKLRELEAFRTGFGFDANELIEFILADRRKHELQARVDELSKLGGFLFTGDIHVRGRHQRSYDDRIAELKQELDEVAYMTMNADTLYDAKQFILDWNNKQVKNAVATAEDNLDQYWNKELDKQIEAVLARLGSWQFQSATNNVSEFIEAERNKLKESK